MGTINNKPAAFVPGQKKLSAASLNMILKAIPRLITGGDGIEVRTFHDKLVITARKNKAVDVEPILLNVLRWDEPNFVICERGGKEVWVAKPSILRQGSSFPTGPTYAYTDATHRIATEGETTEPQVITPAYSIGEEIAVMRCHTKLQYDVESTETLTTYTVNCMLLDMNIAGRCWAQGE